MQEEGGLVRYLDVQQTIDMLGDEASARGILDQAYESLHRSVHGMRACMKTGDVLASGRFLHTVKGMIPIFCRAELVGRVASAEQLARSANAQAFQPVWEPIDMSLARLLEEMAEYLGRAD